MIALVRVFIYQPVLAIPQFVECFPMIRRLSLLAALALALPAAMLAPLAHAAGTVPVHHARHHATHVTHAHAVRHHHTHHTADAHPLS